ncbi:unnamed protein product [Hymenolepis diminuta]|uniref:Uncharacterized protein n=1 Tax=Hymenolepis diminuta TaxID=6216 RepID=A0A564YRY4_HYMDI|nr:unnamed protein product [Hymenolepis diminuta]
MTPLRETEEKIHEHRPSGHWTPMKLALESGNNGSHTTLPVALLPAVCLRSTGTSVVSANNPFVSQAPTTFRSGAGEKLDIDARVPEHASDSGQGGSDEDLRSQSLTQPPPVINLVQLPCEFVDDPWRRAAGGEGLFSEDYVRLQSTTIFNKNITTNNPGDKVVASDHLNLG